jgi:uncharacterized membrane protein
MKYMIIFLTLLCSISFTTKPIEPLASVASIVTWAIVSPVISLLTNTVPNPLWSVGYKLVGRSWPSRYALGGIVRGTVGTLAAVAVYCKVAAYMQEKLNSQN